MVLNIYFYQMRNVPSYPQNVFLTVTAVASVLLVCFLLPSTVFSEESNSYIGIKRFTISSPAMEYYQSLDVLLYQRLNFDILPHGLVPVLVTDSIPSDCIALASGSVEIVDSLPFLIFNISGIGSNAHEEETKKIPLDNQPVDAIVDMMSLKIRHFLDQNISGRVRISSNPMNCNIYLNGVKIGNTPAELTLEQGRYAVRLQREYFLPYKDSIMVSPGRETNLSAGMEFEGHKLRPWVASATILSISTLLLQLAESYFHSSYMSLTPEEGDKFEPYFNRYKTTNFIKIVVLIPTVTTWTISASHYFENKKLKQRIFNE